MTRTEPCSWPLTHIESCPALDALADDTEDSPRDLVQRMATSYLWRWTGKHYGLCETTVRPARQDCTGYTTYGYTPGGAPWHPVLVDGTWRNVWCGRCSAYCTCSHPQTVALPGPVDQVAEVRIDGVALDSAAYRVDNRSLLIRDDGGSWPLCNDLSKPEGEEGTWAVDYTRGIPVPVGGQVAAGVLACELAKALQEDSDCALPQRVQTVTREGVTVGVLDPFEGLDVGRTGIWLVDAWVASVTAPPPRSRVASPDRMPARRTTSPGGGS